MGLRVRVKLSARISQVPNGDPITTRGTLKFSFERLSRPAGGEGAPGQVHVRQGRDSWIRWKVRFHLNEPWPEFHDLIRGRTANRRRPSSFPKKYVNQVGDGRGSASNRSAQALSLRLSTKNRGGSRVVVDAYTGYWARVTLVQ